MIFVGIGYSVKSEKLEKVCHPRMVRSGIHGVYVWIPDNTLGNDKLLYYSE
jgi:hypothetical protein